MKPQEQSMNRLIAVEASASNLTKTDLLARANKIVSFVENGDITATGASTILAGIIHVCTAAKKAMVEYAVREVEGLAKYETCIINGATITVANTGKYDYSECGDEEYNVLVMRLEALEAQVKAREDFLKAMTKPEEITDTETGEILTVRPAKKTSEKIIKITFPK